MGGTKDGGKAAAASNKAKHGEDFYQRIGAMGGRKSSDGGFGSDKVGRDGLTGRERASKYGVLGGRKSKRRPSDG